MNLFIEQLYQLSKSGQALGQFGDSETAMALEKVSLFQFRAASPSAEPGIPPTPFPLAVAARQYL